VESTHISNLKKKGIAIEQGSKSKNDKIIIFHGKALSMEILGNIYAKMCKIQNDLHPDDQGTRNLANFLKEIRRAGGLTEEIRSFYRVSEEEDKIIALRGMPVTKEIFGLIYSEMCKVQDDLYPYGKGANYLAEYLEEIRKNGTLNQEIRTKFKV